MPNKLQHFTNQRLFLLCLEVHRLWYRLNNSDAEFALINAISPKLKLPGRVLILVRFSNYRMRYSLRVHQAVILNP